MTASTSPDLHEVQWTLVAYAGSTWAARYSKRHLMRDGEMRTLCGITPPLNTAHGQNNAGKCRRCFAAAGARSAHDG